MAVPQKLLLAKGLWHGPSKLNLSFLPPERRVTESNSRLHIDTDGHHSYATITYDWSHDGKRQEGTMLVSQDSDSKKVSVGWVDSWHQSSSIMQLVGNEDANGKIHTTGHYGAGGQTWGWDIDFEFVTETLQMTMTNISPKGEAEWAVRATYRKE